MQLKERVDARNELEGFAYSLKNQVADEEKLGAKLSEDDKKAIDTAANETISWLESNQQAEKEELQAQKKKLEGVSHPIIEKVYGEGGAQQGKAEGKDEL